MTHRAFKSFLIMSLGVLMSLPLWGQSFLVVPLQFSTIQGAVNAAQDGDTILVLPGSYLEKVIVDGVHVDIVANEGASVTTIDAVHSGTAVTLCNGADGLFSGFRVIGGFGTPSATTFAMPGGMLVENASPTIDGCLFEMNTGGTQVFSSTAIDPHWGGPGGMVVANGSPVVKNTIFRSNLGGLGAPVPAGFGPSQGGSGGPGGLGVASGSPIFEECRWESNLGGTGGAGLSVAGEGGSGTGVVLGHLTFQRCAVIQNVGGTLGTALGGGQSGGGGIQILGEFVAHNSLFADNRLGDFSPFSGGAIDARFGLAQLQNCTVVDNCAANLVFAPIVPDGGLSVGAMTEATNCIFWGNEPARLHPTLLTPMLPITFSIIEGDGAGTGNTADAPTFIDPTRGDYRLVVNSVGTDAGTNAIIRSDSLDLEGAPRIADGLVDMGAFETAPRACAIENVLQSSSESGLLRIDGCPAFRQAVSNDKAFLVSIDSVLGQSSTLFALLAKLGASTVGDDVMLPSGIDAFCFDPFGPGVAVVASSFDGSLAGLQGSVQAPWSQLFSAGTPAELVLTLQAIVIEGQTARRTNAITVRFVE